MEGVEAHGQCFASDLQLAEPENWGKAPWSLALDSLFEAPLDIDNYKTCFQRGLVTSPWDLLPNSVEQIVSWVNHGIAPKDISLVHPEPEKIREFLEILLRNEGVPIRSSISLSSIFTSETWSPIWNVLEGLAHFDPGIFASGLQSSKYTEIRHWASILASSDESGKKSFNMSIRLLNRPSLDRVMPIWQSLMDIKENPKSPIEWAEVLTGIVTSQLCLQIDAADFYPLMGLLKECWGGEHFVSIRSKRKWDFERMLSSLRIFLESARSIKAPVEADGVLLLAPSHLVEDWDGSDATLILDLSEGAWPALPHANPDLDWTCRASINSALLQASQNYKDPFPPALQRFWLPRAEHAEQIPRAFQRDAYAFNKVLAMTRKHIVALSPAQDERGRKIAQGPFWTAIDGAGKWETDKKYCFSNQRWAWEGLCRKEIFDNRSKSVRVIGANALFDSIAPIHAHMQDIRATLLNQNPHLSPTLLESLARCPFRTVAERVWRLSADDMSNQLQKKIGTVSHRILHTLLEPVLHIRNWAEAFINHYELADTGIGRMEDLVRGHWRNNQEKLTAGAALQNDRQFVLLQQQIESLLPRIAAYLRCDLEETSPTQPELDFLHFSQSEGWIRTIVGLEQKIGPLAMSDGIENAVTVAGILDRIELWENSVENFSFHRITDYKTTTKSRLNVYAAGDAPFGSHLQAPLYTWMAMEAYNIKATSVFVPLRELEPKPFSKHLKTLSEFDLGAGQWQSRLAKTMSKLDARIIRGDFPPTPGDHCQHCKLDALCMRPVDIVVFEDEYSYE
jgi:hypothetical protein